MKNESRYWDSATIVALLNGEQGRAPTVMNILRDAEAGRIQIYTSALTIAECLKLNGKKPIKKEDRRKVVEFFEHHFITVISVDRWVAKVAQEFVWEFNVAPKDAIHVATAVKKKIAVFETYDNGLIARTGKLGEYRLLIREPLEYAGQPSLFDKQQADRF